MKSKVRIFGHPLHQALVVFPLGLLATTVIFDLIWLGGRSPDIALVAWYLLSAGLLGVVVAAPFGTIDWLAIPPGTRAKRIGAMHGIGNVVVATLFFISWLQRDPALPPTGGALLCSIGGGMLALVTAWLGGELVSRLGIGVYDDAGVNASSSLKLKD